MASDGEVDVEMAKLSVEVYEVTSLLPIETNHDHPLQYIPPLRIATAWRSCLTDLRRNAGHLQNILAALTP